MPPTFIDSPANSATIPLSDTIFNRHVGKTHISQYGQYNHSQAVANPSDDRSPVCTIIPDEKKELALQSEQEINIFYYDTPQIEHHPSFRAIPNEAFVSPINVTSIPFTTYNLDAQSYSSQFPAGHTLNPHFIQLYQLLDELGSGSYGFVMTACHRGVDHEVAVKFITKTNIPDHAWVEDEDVGRLPMEVVLLCSVDHVNIVKCIDFFEDGLYFYLVQELHGSPWRHDDHIDPISRKSPTSRTPSLSPSTSEDSLATSDTFDLHPFDAQNPRRKVFTIQSENSDSSPEANYLSASPVARPGVHRRPSYDLFECIEQSEFKRLTVDQARYIFSQVVEAVHYLDSRGISHRDIKDENLVVDKNMKVKIIDFGSAVIADPDLPRPFYKRFYGTTAYAAPEILLEKSYQAPPAEVWTLGILLSYLLTGAHPFPTVEDATKGKFSLNATEELPESAISLMQRCLDPNPRTRATIREIKDHDWLLV